MSIFVQSTKTVLSDSVHLLSVCVLPADWCSSCFHHKSTFLISAGKQVLSPYLLKLLIIYLFLTCPFRSSTKTLLLYLLLQNCRNMFIKHLLFISRWAPTSQRNIYLIAKQRWNTIMCFYLLMYHFVVDVFRKMASELVTLLCNVLLFIIKG